jgi:hypothetical protein
VSGATVRPVGGSDAGVVASEMPVDDVSDGADRTSVPTTAAEASRSIRARVGRSAS